MTPDPSPEHADLFRLRSDLLAHYDGHRRSLPWRDTSDPYRILVSEVMLQQTRVDTVLGYYARWLRRFPDLDALAEAPEADVLKAWEGLGYYRRARNLHACAREVRDRWDGSVPRTATDLRSLPGVGAYTAGAVASIAFNEPVPAVDGNVRRVLARLFDVADPKPKWLRDTADALLHRERPGDWNQALMELGATVCTPRAPRCDACPVAWTCAAREAGTVDERPQPAARRAPRPAVFALCVLRGQDGAVLLQRRPAGGLLGGLWAFPEEEIDSAAEAERAVRALAGTLLAPGAGARVRKRPPAPSRSDDERGQLSLSAAVSLPEVRHRFTHIHATYVPWRIDLAWGAPPRPEPRSPELRWASPEELRDLALPVAQRTVLEHV